MSEHRPQGTVDGRRRLEDDRPMAFGPSPTIMRRREAAAQARRRRLMLGDGGIALVIVLIALIAGVGIGMLGVVAILVLALLGIGVGIRRLWMRRGRRAPRPARRRPPGRSVL